MHPGVVVALMDVAATEGDAYTSIQHAWAGCSSHAFQARRTQHPAHTSIGSAVPLLYDELNYSGNPSIYGNDKSVHTGSKTHS